VTGIRLFQEDLRKEPFWLLVGCVLCNRTKWSQAEPVFEEIRHRWPTPRVLAEANEGDLMLIVKPIGFQNRVVKIIQLAATWTYAKIHRIRITTETVGKLPGCGRYAQDSYAIFIEGRKDIEPEDLKLREYMKRC